MTIKQFIEAATGEEVDGISLAKMNIHAILLDPKAWEAVGRVKGWDENPSWFGGHSCSLCEYPGSQSSPKYHMGLMVKFLCEGKTLEDYIATL